MPFDSYYGLLGRVRKTTRPSYSEGVDVVPAINDAGEILMSMVLPPKTELTRLGQTWNAKIATGSAFTHVAAWPTTRAELVLHNGEAAGGKTYVIDSAWAVNAATSIAAASAYTLIGQIVAGATAPTDDTAQLITSRCGKTYNGLAKRAVAQTTMTANKWEVLAAAPAGPAASIGLAVYADLQGSWILRPGDMLGLNLVVGTATGTAIIGVTWHEVQLPTPP